MTREAEAASLAVCSSQLSARFTPPSLTLVFPISSRRLLTFAGARDIQFRKVCGHGLAKRILWLARRLCSMIDDEIDEQDLYGPLARKVDTPENRARAKAEWDAIPNDIEELRIWMKGEI